MNKYFLHPFWIYLIVTLALAGSAQAADWFELKPAAESRNKNSLTVFYGRGTTDTIIDILTTNVDYLPYDLVSVAYAQELAEFDRFLYLFRNVILEGEVQYAYHYGDQKYSELTTAALLRLHKFPWNVYLKTTA